MGVDTASMCAVVVVVVLLFVIVYAIPFSVMCHAVSMPVYWVVFPPEFLQGCVCVCNLLVLQEPGSLVGGALQIHQRVVQQHVVGLLGLSRLVPVVPHIVGHIGVDGCRRIDA